MEGARHPSRMIAVIAAVLLSAGGVAAFGSIAWWNDGEYTADVAAPEGVAWTLWLPQPDTAAAAVVEGSAALHGSVPTPFGSLLNATGTGSVRFRFAVSGFTSGSAPLPSGPRLNLTGRNGTGTMAQFPVWRASADPGANITVSGGIRQSARNLESEYHCGGNGFLGTLAEGWTMLPVLESDCTALLSSFPGLMPGFLPAALLSSGAILAASVFQRRRLPAA